MTSIDGPREARARHDDLAIRGEFNYDAEKGSMAWSAIGVGGRLELDDLPVRGAIDLSIREGTPFSVNHRVLDEDGVAHELVLCGLPDTQQGHTTVRGMVLELSTGIDERVPAPRLTRRLGPLPSGVSVESLPWSGPDGLPAELLAMLNLCLESSLPTTLIWGEQRRVVYNQAYADMIPQFHPRLFGAVPQPPAVDWPEGWIRARQHIEEVFASGEPMALDDQLLPVTVDGVLRDRWFTFSLTPIRQDDGTVAGVYAPATETTLDVQRRRRLASLHDLASSGVADGSIPELLARITATLDSNPADIPFALIYVIGPGGREAVLMGSTGLAGTDRAAAHRLSLDSSDVWPVVETLERKVLMMDDVQDRFPGLRTRCDETPTRAMLAFADQEHDRLPSALTILGVSPRQSLDIEYQQFMHQVTRQIQADVTAVASAQLDRERSANLQRAMQSNRQIGAAIGILMTIHKVTEQQAFQLLSKASQQTNRKLRDIADDVILSGMLPADTLPAPSRRSPKPDRRRP